MNTAADAQTVSATPNSARAGVASSRPRAVSRTSSSTGSVTHLAYP